MPPAPVTDVPASQRYVLVFAALLVLAAHAAVLWHWPQWMDAPGVDASLQINPLETRRIAPPAPPAPPVAAPAPQRPQPPAAQPAPPRSRSFRKPLPAPAAKPLPAAPDATAAPAAQAAAATDAKAHEGQDAAAPPARPAASSTAPAIPPGVLAFSRAKTVLPPSFTLNYDAKGQVKGVTNGASGSLQWRNDGNARYSSTLAVNFLGGLFKFSFGSEGAITAHGLRPDRYTENRRGSIRQAMFERDASGESGAIRFSNGRPDVPLMPGAQDYMSVVLQLTGLANAAAGQLSPGKSFELQTAGPNSAAVWKVRVEPAEPLQIGAASVPAIKLRQLPASDQGRTTEVWLIPADGAQGALLPGRIRLSEPNGDFVELVLKALPNP